MKEEISQGPSSTLPPSQKNSSKTFQQYQEQTPIFVSFDFIDYFCKKKIH